MIIKTNRMLFVTDEEHSDKYIEKLITEYGTNTYIISIDKTLIPPYYSLYYRYKDANYRTFSDRLFASSNINKIIKFVNDNIF